MEAKLIVIYCGMINRVSKLEVGEKLDVRDPNYVWKVATIKRLKVSQDL